MPAAMPDASAPHGRASELRLGDGHPDFSYDDAFSRNLGWLTAGEQQHLRGRRIALAGLGGVGGSHLLTLARLGIGAFHIADFDEFELANFNRQAGATMSSLGRPKAATLAAMARDINPGLDLEVFPAGVGADNLDAFLAGVDVYVDSLDFFVLDVRAKLFARCYALGIPAVCAAPIGMGTGYLVFMPGGTTFEEWFRLEGLPPERQRVNFMLGLTPRGFQRGYLMDPSRVDLAGRRGPSTGIACELCAGVAAAEVLKLLLKRGPVRAVPWYHQFDAYRGKFVRGWLPGGNANPLQRLKLQLAYRLSRRLTLDALPAAPRPRRAIEAILDKARWSPSGDNIQPWRFEIADENHVTVHVASDGSVYDYDRGTPTLLAAGFLLEGLRIAGSEHGRALAWRYLGDGARHHRIAVALDPSPHVTADPLARFLSVRSVDRRAYRLTKLTPQQKEELAASLGSGLELEWRESAAERWRMARLNALATDIRLRIPEAYAVHRRIVDIERNFSPTGIPMKALGLDPAARRLMKWALADWCRMAAMNRVAGTALARLEMDLVPGWYSAAHFLVRHKRPALPREREEFLLQCGQRLHRFWLTATELGLVLQPSLAPLCFAHHGREGSEFTGSGEAIAKARRLAAQLDAVAGASASLIFMGRLGEPRSRRIASRSIRRAPDELVTG